MREVDKGIRKVLAPKNVRELPPEWPVDFSDFSKNLWRTVSPYTMTSKERVISLEAAVRYLCAYDIAGDMVECGVAAGGSVMAIAVTLMDLGTSDRHLWLYDTFEGMPAPTEHDIGRFDTPAMKLYKKRHNQEGGWIRFSVEDVKANVLSTGYPEAQFQFIQGKVEEISAEIGSPADSPAAVGYGLVRIDEVGDGDSFPSCCSRRSDPS